MVVRFQRRGNQQEGRRARVTVVTVIGLELLHHRGYFKDPAQAMSINARAFPASLIDTTQSQ